MYDKMHEQWCLCVVWGSGVVCCEVSSGGNLSQGKKGKGK